MKPEQALWKLIKSHVPGHAQRIENAAGVGLFDTNYCFHGREKWLELKVSNNKRLLTNDQVVHLLRVDQSAWAYHRLRAGGACNLLVRQDDILIYCILSPSFDNSIGVFVAGRRDFPKPFDWSLFTDFLGST